jgi:hypothetical protein
MTADRASFESRFRAHFGIFTGTPREIISAEEETLITGVLHDDVRFMYGDKQEPKSIVEERARSFIKSGMKAEVLEFKFLDDSHVEYKIRLTTSDGMDNQSHSLGTIKEGKIITVKPYDDKAYMELFEKGEELAQSSFETRFRAYFGIFTGTPREIISAEEETLITGVFHDDLRFMYGDKKEPKSIVVERVRSFIKSGMKAEVLEFEFLDDSHVEYKVHLTTSDGMDNQPHSLGTIKEGKLITVKPYDDKAYMELFEKGEELAQPSFESKVNKGKKLSSA